MADFSFHNKTVVLMLKVAMLGGAERQALGLADYLIKNFNCQVHVVATHSNEPTKEFHDFAATCGIHKIHFFGVPSLVIKKDFSIQNLKKIFRAFRYLFIMKREIAKFKPDVIIPFLNSPSKIAALIFNYTGAKFTFWHQLGLDTYSFDWLEKKAVKKAPFIVANAQNGLAIFEENYKVDNNKLFVLPQYVSIKKIEMDRKKILHEFGIPDDSIVIGMIAHYRNEKFQELLIKAFSMINPDYKIHLVFLGNKDNSGETISKYDDLIALAAEKNLQTKVTFLSGESVEKVLNCIDIGVLVSEIEGTPNVVMEYMLYGLPVIASNHAGCVGLLETSDFLIPNDEVLLKEKLLLLITDEELRKAEGNRNAEKIKKYSIESYFSKLSDIINSKV